MNEGESFVVEATSPDLQYVCVFEDDGETGYLYLCLLNPYGEMEGIADALWIYNRISPPIHSCEEVGFVWDEHTTKVAFVVDGECWGLLDLKAKRKITAGRENATIVPLPVSLWEKGIQVSEGEPLQITVGEV